MELVHEIYCVWSRMFGIFKSKEVSSCQKWFILSSREIAEQKVVGNTSHAKSFISFLFVSNKTIRLLDVISFRVAPIRPMVIVWTQLLFCVDFRSTKSMYTHSSSTFKISHDIIHASNANSLWNWKIYLYSCAAWAVEECSGSGANRERQE